MGRPYFSSIVPSIGTQHLAGQGMLAQGQAWFCDPSTGADGNSGKRPDRPTDTLYNAGAGSGGAYNLATANRNDVIYMIAGSNTAATTTDYQSTALTWDKNLTHLIGVGGGSMFSQRSRIAFASTYNTAADLLTVSASGCLFANMQFFEGVAGTSPTGCLHVSGSRNKFFNCHIAGIGNDANDIAGAYSLKLTGSENLFERCVIGLDTVDRGSAANQEILITSGSKNVFKDCYIISRVQHATNSPQVRVVGAGSLGDPSFVLFDNCVFISTSTNYNYTQTYVVAFTAALTAGYIIARNCTAVGASNWANTGQRMVINNTAINTAYTAGTGYAA